MGQIIVNPVVDGYASSVTGGSSWHSAVSAIGVSANNLMTIDLIRATSDTVENQWSQVVRTFFSFDTSGIPNDATIDSATLTLRGYDKKNEFSATWVLALYDAILNNPTLVAAGDFANAGVVLLSSTIAYAAWSTSGDNVLTLNAAGLANISKTGNTIMCVRDVTYDVADELDPNNHDPAWTTYNLYYMRWVGSGAESNKPFLTVNYTEAPVVQNPGGAYISRNMLWRMSSL
jgi:hypothetical protein